LPVTIHTERKQKAMQASKYDKREQKEERNMRELQPKKSVWKGKIYAREVIDAVLRLGAGFLLARCVVFSAYAPFGVSFLSATAGTPSVLFSMVGAVAGYASLMKKISVFQYLAECFLILSVSPLLRIALSEKKRLYPVILLTVSSIPMGLTTLFQSSPEASNWVMFGAEVLLTVLGGYIFRMALEREGTGGEEWQGCRYILIILSLSSFSGVLIYGVSVGRSLCILAALSKIGQNRSIRTGTAAGLMAGIASDMTLGYPPLFALTMAIGGMVAAVFQKFGRLLCALSFVTAGAVITVWGKAIGGGAFDLSNLYEYIVGAGVYLLIPAAVMRKEELLWPMSAEKDGLAEEGYPHADLLRKVLYDRLYMAADAYMTVADETVAMKHEFSEELIIPALRETGCDGCENRGECAEKGMAEKAFTLSRAYLENKGRVERRQLPDEFLIFCTRSENFCRQLEKLWYASRVQKSYNSRLNRGLELLAGQYRSMCSLLGQAAQMLSEETVFNKDLERRVNSELERMGIKANALVVTGQRGQLTMYVEGKNIERHKEKLEELLKDVTGKSIKPYHMKPGILIWKEEAELTFLLGSASRKKQGSMINGDYGSWFTVESRLYVLVADGMGSGKEAQKESLTFGNMVEKLIRGGIDPTTALKTAMDTRMLAQGMVPTTADLLEVELFGGGTSFYKSGASPSYIRGEKVRKVQTNGLYGEKIAVSREFLLPGDVVVMATDGAEDGLEKNLTATRATEPQALCRELLEKLSDDGHRKDDCSVVAVFIQKNEKAFDKSAAK